MYDNYDTGRYDTGSTHSTRYNRERAQQYDKTKMYPGNCATGGYGVRTSVWKHFKPTEWSPEWNRFQE